MDFSAPHVGFVIASYLLSLVLIVVLTIWTLGRDRRLRHEAQRLEAERRKDTA